MKDSSLNQPVVSKRAVTLDRIIEALESGEDAGFCLSCGEQAFGVEPDARKYKCEACGRLKVYGAEELMIMFGC